MNKFIQSLSILVLFCILNCNSRNGTSDKPSKKLNIKKMFSLNRSEEWENSIRKSVAFQMETCDSFSTYASLNTYLKFELENLPFKMPVLSEWDTPRRDILAYLSTSNVIPDSIPYTNIYLKYYRQSGGTITKTMVVTIINGSQSTYYYFNRVNISDGGRNWRVAKVRVTDETEINNLFPQFSCSTTNCELELLNNENLIISKFGEDEIESKVIVKDCKNKIDQLNKIYKLANSTE